MASFASLPYEIQKLILEHIDITKQLGECRLVCKSWDGPAECAMFTKPLYVTDSNTSSIHVHLARKPQRANLIKEIRLGYSTFTNATAQLLRVAITPSIERISSSKVLLSCMQLYQTIAQVGQESGIKLQHLKSIPWTHSDADAYYKTALLFKNSLEEIAIPALDDDSPHEIAQHLEEFKSLSTLVINYCVFTNLPQVESILRGACHVKEIILKNCCLYDDWSKEDRLNWMYQNTNISENAITLKAFVNEWFAEDGEEAHMPLIEYFLHKYPNIQHFVYDEEYDADAINDVEADRRICTSISRIPSYTLHLTKNKGWQPYYISFAGDQNTFRLDYRHTSRRHDYIVRHEHVAKNQISSKKAQNQKRSTEFHFSADDNSIDDRLVSHVAFLKNINKFTTSLHMIFGNPRPFYHFLNALEIVNESVLFFKALEVMDRLQDLKLALEILEPGIVDFSPHYTKRQLNKLEISGAKIQPGAFDMLDRFFHVIRDLELSNCYIKRDRTNTICIHLSTTSLQKLSLTMQLESIPSHYSQPDLENKLALSNDTYLMVNLQQRTTLYFKLTPSCSDVHQVSFVEYFSRPSDANAISIYCHLIANIELDLGKICASIDVKKYCTSLDITFEKLNE